MEKALKTFEDLNHMLHRLHAGEHIQNAELLQTFSDLAEVAVSALNENTALRREASDAAN